MRRKAILGILAVLATAVSCNYLDFDETSSLYDHDSMYKYFGNARQMLNNIYSYMPQDLGTIDGAMRDCASDDAEYGNVGASVQSFNNGRWSAVDTYDTAWNLYYGVRSANEFLSSIGEVDLSRYEYDSGYASNVRNLKIFPYEARLLRAYYLFELAKRYGDIAMPLEMLSIEQANTIGKTPFAEVIEFIVSECDVCADNLPVRYDSDYNDEVGRVTKGFALAVKSKALLYAASELHNPSMDTELWKTAAKAALDLIAFAPEAGYALDPANKWDNSVNSSITTSPEVILMRMNGDDNSFELNNFPIRFTLGNRTGNVATATFPTQNLVDAFQTVNGYAVTLGDNGWECDDPAFDPRNPYANRDPRFYWTVLADGSTFKDSEIQTRIGGQDNTLVASGGTPTGYFLRKYVQEGTDFDTDNPVTNKHHWIIYRYAETLLAYAESMAEAFGDPDYTDGTFTLSAADALNQVRTNAGMPAVSATGKEEFIEAVRNEWRVEFAFEDHRFWDVRRWKIGAGTQQDIYGVTIADDGNGGLTYQRSRYETRTWSERMYLYPIPQSELFKNPNLNPQNTGW